MKQKYSVKLSAMGIVRGCVHVEADSQLEANALAVTRATEGDITWTYDGVYDSGTIEVDRTDPLDTILPPVPAECHSDDRVYESTFDAARWFKQATEEAILALARCCWGGDYASDQVAIDTAEWNDEVAGMFRYIERKNASFTSRDTIGFECHVERKEAYAWIKANMSAEFLSAVFAADPEEFEEDLDSLGEE